jgi:hypothetical protein
LEADNFPRLLAYVGEVVRHAVGGHWEMVFASDDEVWEAWIVDGFGTRHAVFGLLVKELIEWDEEVSSIGVVIDAVIRSSKDGRENDRSF